MNSNFYWCIYRLSAVFLVFISVNLTQFTILDCRCVNSFLQHLDIQRPSINLNMDKEIDNKNVFLNISVTKEPDGCLATSIYRKPTNTDQIMLSNRLSKVAWFKLFPLSVVKFALAKLGDLYIKMQWAIQQEVVRWHQNSVPHQSHHFPSSKDNYMYNMKKAGTWRDTHKKVQALRYFDIKLFCSMRLGSLLNWHCLLLHHRPVEGVTIKNTMGFKQCNYWLTQDNQFNRDETDETST